MADFTGIVEQYLAAWNETDARKRGALVDAVFAPGARYVDPMAEAAGAAAITAAIGAVQEQFPGLRFALVGDVDQHHDQARFRWGLGPAGGEPLAVGVDVVVRGADGRLTTVLGFLDRVPAA